MIKPAAVAAFFALAITSSAFSEQAQMQQAAFGPTGCWPIFERLDSNKDGVLSTHELRAAQLSHDLGAELELTLAEFIAECEAD